MLAHVRDRRDLAVVAEDRDALAAERDDARPLLADVAEPADLDEPGGVRAAVAGAIAGALALAGDHVQQ